MQQEVKSLKGYRYIVTSFNYKEDKEIIDNIINKALRMTNSVNPHGPDGKLRQQDVRFNKLLGGLLAEFSVINFLEEKAKEHNIDFYIISSTFGQEEDLAKLGFNQIDLKILVKGTEKQIEIRSSFSYKTTFNRLIGVPLKNGKGAFSIIGWYTTKNKPKEIKKDYYLFAIHLYLPSETQHRLLNKVKVYFAGAASKKTLDEKGERTSLKQSGANFRVINPLNSVPDPIEVINEILGVEK